MTINTGQQLKSQLETLGILVHDTWIEYMLHQGISDVNQLITVYLNADVYTFCTDDGVLPHYEASQEIFTRRSMVLQIEELVNIGAPLEHRKSDQNATFKVFLTDGHRSVVGLLLDRIPGISWNTTIGSKIFVREAYIRHGILLLHCRNCKYLGGKEIMRETTSSLPAYPEQQNVSSDQQS